MPEQPKDDSPKYPDLDLEIRAELEETLAEHNAWYERTEKSVLFVLDGLLASAVPALGSLVVIESVQAMVKLFKDNRMELLVEGGLFGVLAGAVTYWSGKKAKALMDRNLDILHLIWTYKPQPVDSKPDQND